MIPLRLKIKAVLVFLLAGGLQATLSLSPVVASAEGQKQDIKLERCYLDGVERSAKCFDLVVPLDWNNPAGEQITLHGAIVPAKAMQADSDPLLVLAGGPGQAATDYGPFVSRAFHKINESREIILIDQRGTGDSHELNCEFPEVFGHISHEALRAFGKACSESFNVDTRYFTSLDIVADLEYARVQLGFEKINLWGGSYGTRLGLLYMRQYPDVVRSAILDGVTPPNNSLFLMASETAEAAWKQLIEDCRADSDCSKAYPELDARFRQLLSSLEETPQEAQYRNPATGEMMQGLITRAWLAEAVRGALYVPTYAALLPYAISQAEKGDYSSVAALTVNSAAWAGSTMSIGSTLSILCREDIPTVTDAKAKATGANSFHRDVYYRNWAAMCADWPVFAPPQDYNAPVTAHVPTLILSGRLDPITPAATGNVAAASLPNVLHMVAENAGHNVSPFGCAPDLMNEFLVSAGTSVLDGSCLNEPVRPPFVITPAGSKP